jgi:predicted GIY-YIG superfamily endonuclease
MTSNLEKRLSDHRAGRGAKVTKRYGVKSLVKAVPCSTREEALTLEQEITDELRADGWLVWGGKNCSPLRDGHFWVDD